MRRRRKIGLLFYSGNQIQNMKSQWNYPIESILRIIEHPYRNEQHKSIICTSCVPVCCWVYVFDGWWYVFIDKNILAPKIKLILTSVAGGGNMLSLTLFLFMFSFSSDFWFEINTWWWSLMSKNATPVRHRHTTKWL